MSIIHNGWEFDAFLVRDRSGQEREMSTDELANMHPIGLQELLVWLPPEFTGTEEGHWTRGSRFAPDTVEVQPDGTVLVGV